VEHHLVQSFGRRRVSLCNRLHPTRGRASRRAVFVVRRSATVNGPRVALRQIVSQKQARLLMACGEDVGELFERYFGVSIVCLPICS
jgi:hypothetical protein